MANAVIEGKGIATEGESSEAETTATTVAEQTEDFEAELAAEEKVEFEVPELAETEV